METLLAGLAGVNVTVLIGIGIWIGTVKTEIRAMRKDVDRLVELHLNNAAEKGW